MRVDPGHAPSRPGRGPDPAEEATRLAGVLAPVISAAGLDLEAVRITAAGRRRLVRVVVDADGGVGLDGIASMSREISQFLDASGAMGEAPYTLEVSSPGVERPLTEPRHWRRATGRLVTAPLTAPSSATSSRTTSSRTTSPRSAGQARPASVRGRVLAASDAEVTLEVDGDARRFGYAELGPGRVQVEFGGGSVDGH